MVDIAKRRRVMQRSQRLGHCICDPRRGCPCGVFTEQGICPCAGERPEPIGDVRLTTLVHNAGCASKIPPQELEAVLSRLPVSTDPAVLSGIPAGDDAAVYRLADGTCLVQTVDVMTPCVDDAETFGRICAANCLSDIYAMGGTPRTALSILAFPSETLDGQLMYRMLKGATDIFTEAGVALIGGHSIKDEEIKLGFAITGTVLPEQLVERGTAKVGDLLVLTKPLGTGILNFARQIGRPVDMTDAEASMATLNRAAADAMVEAGASACTDVTGFGLFGHLIGMCRHSGVAARIAADALPAFPGSLESLREGVVPGAIERNREYVGDDITVADGVEEARVHLGFDAQTSGGLLIAVPPDRHAALLAALQARGVAGVTIGCVTGLSAGHIDLVASTEEQIIEVQTMSTEATPHAAECCADVFTSPQGNAADKNETARAFGAFMRTTNAAGVLDARTKELITFSLVLLSRCVPCLQAHLKKAREMGITDAELEEVAWCAIAMGGAPVKMFYEEGMEANREGSACCP